MMPLWGTAGEMQETSVPTENERADALAERIGNRNAAGVRTTKKDKKRLSKLDLTNFL
jgi:hypothetical protein